MVELTPPLGHTTDAVLEQARRLRSRGVDAVHVPEGPAGPRVSALALAAMIQATGIETVLQYASRNRSLLGMQSDLLGAHAMGLHNVVIVTGDVRPSGDYPDATAVFDVDSIGLVNVVSRLNHGLDVGGQTIGAPTAFHVGVAVNPGAEDLDAEIRRFEYKVEAGAEFAVTRPVFDVPSFERVFGRLESARLPIVLGLAPLENLVEAEFLANEVPGMRVPDEVLARMRRAGSPGAQAAEGVAIAQEIAAALKNRVHGLHVAAPRAGLESVLEVVGSVR
jgi:homocysteine S-methyltransferase